MSDIDDRFRAASQMQTAGELARAEPIYRSILQAQPDYVPALRKLGIVLHRRGNTREAIDTYRRYLRHQPDDSGMQGNLGLALHDCGRLDEAIAALQHALALNPSNADAHNSLGATYQQLGRHKDAESCFRRATELAGRANHHANLGRSLFLQEELEGAVSSFRRAVELDPADASVWEHLGQACRGLRDTPGAIEAYQRALRLDSVRPATSALLADVYEKSHVNDKAAARARAALRADESQPLAHLVLSRLDRRDGNLDAARSRLEQQLARHAGGDPDTDTISMLFELGLVLDRLHDYDAAYRRVCEGNAAQARLLAEQIPSRDILTRQIRRLQDWVTAERVTAWGNGVDESSGAPVFFVGFPRSGTTLVEQILASHHSVVTTDELPLLRTVKKRCVELQGPAARYPDCLDRLSDDQLENLRRLYFELAAQAVGDTVAGKCLIDKLPLNVIELPLIRRLFPRARVLFALRDPRDVCVSCFMHHFEINEAMVHFSELASTARFYAAVMNLWRHYKLTLDIDYLEYRYEDLIDDTEGVARRIIEFIGLDWNPEVLEYMQAASSKFISTPSYQDVTRPIYRRAVSRWKNYRTQLTPILETLAPFVEAFAYPPAEI